MLLYLVRHPEPLGGHGRCYGRTDLAVHPRSVERTVAALRVPMIADDLQEMDFGAWEGRPWAQIPRDELDAWARDVWCHAPGGGESAGMVAQRWQRWIAQRAAAGGSAVAVTHAGVIRVALASSRVPDAGDVAIMRIAFGAVYRIDMEGGGERPCAGS